MLSAGDPLQVASGETIVMEGDRRTRHVFLIIQGYVKVLSNSADGKVALLAIRAGETSSGSSPRWTAAPGSRRW